MWEAKAKLLNQKLTVSIDDTFVIEIDIIESVHQINHGNYKTKMRIIPLVLTDLQ